MLDTRAPLSAAPVELTSTPFYPQTDFQCGPSALASVLARTDIEVTPGELSGQVYLPERHGSLQLELIAAARRHERLAVQVEPSSRAIIAELEVGRPVLALQNLGVAWLPFWHYSVIVGYTPETDSFVLRSGTSERLILRRAAFERSWARGRNWALVVLAPGELPQSADPESYVRAVVGLESVEKFAAARRAYEVGLERWPTNELLLLGYANALYGSGDAVLAANAYLNLLDLNPGHIPALNNLANVLGDLGCPEQALAVIDRAFESKDRSFDATLNETRRMLDSLPIQSSGCSNPISSMSPPLATRPAG